MPRPHRAVGVAVAVALTLLIAACGGSKSATRHRAGTASTAPSSTTTAAAVVAATGHAANANIAVVDGTPITFGTYEYWMSAAETSNASESKSAVAILPLWPPDFSGCVSQVRQKLAGFKTKSAATVQKDCRGLFSELNNQTLDFLIQGIWFQQYGAAHGVTISSAQVSAQFAKEKAASFKSAAQYHSFLRANGETEADLLYRTKVNLYYKALVDQILGQKKATVKAEAAAADTLATEAEKALKAKTVCATGYATDYCAS